MILLKHGVRFLFVSIGIIVLTSFTIDATDTLSTSKTALSILAGSTLERVCPEGTVRIDLQDKSICMDMYENGIADTCPVMQPSFDSETKLNIDKKRCQSVSKQDMLPWTFVTLHQAKTLCAKRGMRLPSAAEWYEASLGTPDSNSCNIYGSGLSVSGGYSQCVSSRGVYDMVGNAWEWVDTEVIDGTYLQRTIPESGYVMDVDTAGVALTSSQKTVSLYNDDYFYGDSVGIHGMLRGGYYAGGTDAGLFSVHTKVTPSFSSGATGFRCVKNI